MTRATIERPGGAVRPQPDEVPPTATTPPPPPVDEAIRQRVQTEVERAIQRQVKGLEFLRAGDPPVGLTPRESIYARGTLNLYHYRPTADEIYRIPVLLVMSLVSKPYILDLCPGQSLIEYMVGQGFDVYMIDWGTPRPEDSSLRYEDYVLDMIPDCIQRVLDDTGETQVNIVGYCLGGLLSVMYAALHADGPLNALACFTTPFDMEGMGLMRQWSDERYFDVDRIVDTLGNVPPDLLAASFDMLRPVSKAVSQVRLWDNMWNDNFVKSQRMLDRWANDQIPFAGEAFRQHTKELVWKNKLLTNEFELAGRRVDPADIKVPFIHIVGEHDHIVPYAAARALVPAVGSDDKQEVMLKGGHVSLVAGGNAVFRLWPQLSTWLAGRSQ